MHDALIEKTVRELNDCITNPKDRMSEAAIHLMVKLVARSISTTNSAMVEILTKHGIQPPQRKTH